MSLNIVVLAKQVPDTRNVGKDAMTAEGTVNRAALPAIFSHISCVRYLLSKYYNFQTHKYNNVLFNIQ